MPPRARPDVFRLHPYSTSHRGTAGIVASPRGSDEFADMDGLLEDHLSTESVTAYCLENATRRRRPIGRAGSIGTAMHLALKFAMSASSGRSSPDAASPAPSSFFPASGLLHHGQYIILGDGCAQSDWRRGSPSHLPIRSAFIRGLISLQVGGPEACRRIDGSQEAQSVDAVNLRAPPRGGIDEETGGQGNDEITMRRRARRRRIGAGGLLVHMRVERIAGELGENARCLRA